MASSVRVVETCTITPPPESATESSLPLTFFDTYCFKLYPNERLFFYELAADSAAFSTSILPKLKHSLSLTLLHFLPLAGGRLVWPPHSDKPFILYTPGDGVSLTVAEALEDFAFVSGDSAREIPNSHRYVPALNVTETEAATLSFQITLFPNKGFSIGISSHHAAVDGNSFTLFLKAWAFMCRHAGKDNGSPSLPAELAPVFDRTVINDPKGLDMLYVNNWIYMGLHSGMDTNPRSLKLLNIFRSTNDTNYVRGTFTLTGEDVQKLREKALSSGTNEADTKHYSTFVLAYAYVLIAIAKAKRLESKKKLVVVYVADVRARLDPPVHTNYCGNCFISNFIETNAETVIGKDGLTFLAEELTQSIKGLEKVSLDGMEDRLGKLMKMDPRSMELISVTGSPRFGVYDIDFGWGKPNKLEVTSVDRVVTISMVERRGGKSGVEVGVVLKKDEMEMFESLFVDGLN